MKSTSCAEKTVKNTDLIGKVEDQQVVPVYSGSLSPSNLLLLSLSLSLSPSNLLFLSHSFFRTILSSLYLRRCSLSLFYSLSLSLSLSL